MPAHLWHGLKKNAFDHQALLELTMSGFRCLIVTMVALSAAARSLLLGKSVLVSAATGGALALGSAISAGEARSVYRACAADVATFCADAQGPQSRQQCMYAHRSELSDTCRAARQANQGAQRVQGGILASPTGQTAAVARTEGAPGSIVSRVTSRGFPSVFAPWNFGPSREGGRDESISASGERDARVARIARHDLYLNEWNSLGLKVGGDQPSIILSPQFTPDSVQAALRSRAALLAANPNLVILANVHYFAAGSNWLPPDSPWWRGAQRADEYNSRRLDFTNPAFQDKVAELCGALVKTGVFDGCMLDLWNDQWNNRQYYPQEAAARLPLVQKIRAAAGDQAILIANVNGRLPVNTAAYLNGMYMEGLGSSFFPDWRTAAANLLWAQSHLRQPAITALEGWYPCPTPDCLGDPAQIQRIGRADEARMRNTTALSLVFSNGYVLFSDPDKLPTPDHLHDWYPFWNKSLGRPVGPFATLDQPDLSGAYTRRFENGNVVFNPPANPSVTINFQEPRRSAATNTMGRSFTVPAGDGDLFLKTDATQR